MWIVDLCPMSTIHIVALGVCEYSPIVRYRTAIAAKYKDKDCDLKLLSICWGFSGCCLSSKDSSNNIKDRSAFGGGDTQHVIDLILDHSDDDVPCDVRCEPPGFLILAGHWAGGDKSTQEDGEQEFEHLDYLIRLVAIVIGICEQWLISCTTSV